MKANLWQAASLPLPTLDWSIRRGESARLGWLGQLGLLTTGFLLVNVCVSADVLAGDGPSLTIDLGRSGQGQVAVVLQILALLTVLSLVPALFIMATSFTRIVIVLSFLRQAMGTQQVPPNQVLISLALFLTGRGLGRRRPAARVWALALAVPDLLVVPFGTALSVYAFWVLLNDEARLQFGRRPRSPRAGREDRT